MKIEHARKWADALYFGKHKKMKGQMSNSAPDVREPSKFCCLGVLNEVIKPDRYLEDRMGTLPRKVYEQGVLMSINPVVFGAGLSSINDGYSSITPEMSHKEIAFLIDLAIETGEIENV